MSTFSCLRYHLVVSTKHRRPLIAPEWMHDLHEYLGGTVRGLGGVAEMIGGVSDHVHLLLTLKPTHTICDFVRELNKVSSNWVKARFSREFEWQDGYAIFTVSASAVDDVRRYIQNQAEHRARLSRGIGIVAHAAHH